MKKNVTVADIMATKLITLTPKAGLHEAMQLFIKHRISGAPVVDQGALVGVLSERDCIKVLLDDLYQPGGAETVEKFMSKNVVTLPPDMGLVDVAMRFEQTNFRRFPVVDHGRLVGQVSRRDVVRAIVESARTKSGRIPVPKEVSETGRMANRPEDLRTVVGPGTVDRFR